ncbi:MAG: MFS transporter [Sulfitobacter sp.]
MTALLRAGQMARNVTLYPWFKFFQNLIFWQAVWFLFFQSHLSAAEALLLYAIYDVATTALEVPSGYMSDRLGRRPTLVAAAVAGCLGSGLIAFGGGFAAFAVAQILLGASAAFASGTDNALLYESLSETGRSSEVEAQETRGWQFSLTALAVSAVTGGIIAQFRYDLAFAISAGAMAIACGIALCFAEPARGGQSTDLLPASTQWQLFRNAMAQPVLVWLFSLSVLMYGFSHIPFVFGQPFISEALNAAGWQAEAPLVSGSVSALMMIVSVVASLFAIKLRKRIGLPAILMLAFGIQIAIIATLATTNSILAIAVLFLRMVPNSLSRPFIIARMQPLLSDAGRATFLSVQSFGGRLLFAATLLAASANVPDGVELAYGDIRQTLAWYVAAGCGFFVLLWVTSARAKVEPDQSRIT